MVLKQRKGKLTKELTYVFRGKKLRYLFYCPIAFFWQCVWVLEQSFEYFSIANFFSCFLLLLIHMCDWTSCMFISILLASMQWKLVESSVPCFHAWPVSSLHFMLLSLHSHLNVHFSQPAQVSVLLQHKKMRKHLMSFFIFAKKHNGYFLGCIIRSNNSYSR